MRNKKRKSLFVALTLVLLSGIASVGATYAYWATVTGSPTDVEKGNSVEIGVRQDITTTLSVGDAIGDGVLVPENRAGEGQVEYVILKHSVSWKEDSTELATGHAGTLDAEVVKDSVKIDGDATYASLVNFAIQVGGTAPVGDVLGTPAPAIYLDGASVTVYIKVTLTEPENQTAYEAVAGKDITFDVNFTVNPS